MTYPEEPSTSMVSEPAAGSTAESYKAFIEEVCNAAYAYAKAREYVDLSAEGFFAEALSERYNGTPPQGMSTVVEEGHVVVTPLTPEEVHELEEEDRRWSAIENDPT
jgi:hypothetical protein